MSSVEGFPDRDGLAKLVRLAKALCLLVQKFTPLLKAKYPDNITIDTLLLAIAAVCSAIPEVENEFLQETGLNEIPLDNPELIPGINPSRPDPPIGDIT
jgi:hypothetical protein